METKEGEQANGTKPVRKHRATYASDKRKGGYNIRVVGPNADAFVGRTIPVTTKSNEEHEETLIRLFWTGIDKDSGEKVALYTFQGKPRAAEVAEF
jgi:hypothetical protein